MIRRPTPETIELAGQTFTVCFVAHFDPDYRRRPQTNHFCCLCQRDIGAPVDQTPHLHYIDGGNCILAQADEERYQAMSEAQPGRQHAGEMGCFPVGPDCAKKVPPGFLIVPRLPPR